MQYLIIKDNKIIEHYAGGCPKFEESENITILEFDECFASLGDDIRFYKDIEKGIKKTDSELIAEGLISSEEYNLHIDELRQEAYKKEADPLGMQVLRGDIEKDEWLKKIEEIKIRYPKVEVDKDTKQV